MMPTHHLPEDLLVSYAAGTSPEAVSLFVSLHVTLCPSCRDDLAALEAVGGIELERSAGEPISSHLLDATLARLDEPDPAAAQPGVSGSEIPIPRPLLRYIAPAGKPVPRWSRLRRGAAFIPVPLSLNGRPARLIRFKPGFRFGRHRHRGLELTIVLTGALNDGKTRYGVGDVAVGDESIEHAPWVEGNDDCVAFQINDVPEGATVTTRAFYRVYDWVRGLLTLLRD